jgi:hypothetical protein
MMKYSVLFVLAFVAGLVWMFSDSATVVTQKSPEAAAMIEQAQPPVPQANNSRAVEEQPTAQANPPMVEQTMAEPFTADVPYLSPAQRSEGNLGGPPSRSLMLTAPQDVY